MILLELPRQDLHEVNRLFQNAGEPLLLVESDQFDANIDIVGLLMGLTATSAPLVTKVLCELIRARKYIKVKHRGLEVTGLSEHKAAEIINGLMALDKKVSNSD